MKKLSTFLLLVLAMTACSKSQTETPAGYGKVALHVEQGARTFIDLQSTTKATEAIPDTYKVATVTADGIPVADGTGNYGALKNGFTLAAGTGYVLSAYNCTETEALTTPDNWGQQRFYGSTTFDITPGHTAGLSFACQMVNSKISVAYDNSFVTQFDNYLVEVYAAAAPARKLSFDHTATPERPAAFFNVDQTDATLHITISGTRKIGNLPRSYTQTITLLPKAWHKLTVKATSVGSKAGDLDITIDNTVTRTAPDTGINPYE